MSLKVDNYDTSIPVKDLISQARWQLGEPVWRLAGPEIAAFIRSEVQDALRDAFYKAESLYIDNMVKQADQSSRNMMNAILAGANLRLTDETDIDKSDIDVFANQNIPEGK
jgi:hypothetical protein